MAEQTINERFQDFQVAQQIRWIRLGNREAASALAILNRLDRRLTKLLRGIEPERYTEARLAALKQQVENLIDAVHQQELAPALVKSAEDAAVLAGEVEVDAFKRILPAGLDVTTPNLGVLQKAATLKPFNGAVLGDWISDLRQNDLKRTWRTILDDIVAGETTDRIIRDVVGSRSLRYKDGVREVTRRGAQALVRTSINHATNQGRQQVWEKNDDLVKGVKWVATLDTKTTPVCRDRDGDVYAVDDGPRPPAHPNCRSTTVSVLKSWRELGFDVDELPAGTRASMDGQVPAGTTYYQWLAKQSKERQIEVLGPTRYDMWKKQGISPDRFVNDQGKILTLPEIRSLAAKDLSSSKGRVLPSDKEVVDTAVELDRQFSWLGSTTGTTKSALRTYIRHDYSDFAHKVRSGDKLTGKDLSYYNELVDLTTKNTVKAPYVYRGLKTTALNLEADDLFMSTTIAPTKAASWAGFDKGVVLEIKQPSGGFKGAYINAFWQSQKAKASLKKAQKTGNAGLLGEAEVLLPAGTKLGKVGERVEIIKGKEVRIWEMVIE